MKAKDFRAKLSKKLGNDKAEAEIFDIRIWNIDEVAEYMGVSKKHVYNLVSRDEIPFRKKGKLYFIPREIYDWITEEA